MMDFVTERQGVFEDVLQETMLTVYGRGRETTEPVIVHFLKPNGNGKPVQVQEVGRFSLPAKGDEPWLLPREPSQTALLKKMATMPHRLSDYGFAVSTGQLVWNRHKEQLKASLGKQCFPLIWAESVTADGKFRFSAVRRNHAPYFQVRLGQDYLITKGSCVLVQRTTAKEQKRRLIAAVLSEAFVKKHGGVVVENHLNMIRPLSGKRPVAFSVLAALLNTQTLDRAFRCISGSVAVSAYELNALPFPSPEEMAVIVQLVKAGAPPDVIEQTVADIYGGSN
jgi:adenine-specific DNA-methyltransferase